MGRAHKCLSSHKTTIKKTQAAGLAVISRFAEARLLIKEKNEPSALTVLEDLMSRYPRQLSQRKFDELRHEAEMHAGMLLANADRWLEAGVFLERAVPPKHYKPIWSYYLGPVLPHRQKLPTRDETAKGMDCLEHAAGMAVDRRATCWDSLSTTWPTSKRPKRNFEFCVQTADTDLRPSRTTFGDGLKKPLRDLGLIADAERYRKMREVTRGCQSELISRPRSTGAF